MLSFVRAMKKQHALLFYCTQGCVSENRTRSADVINCLNKLKKNGFGYLARVPYHGFGQKLENSRSPAR